MTTNRQYRERLWRSYGWQKPPYCWRILFVRWAGDCWYCGQRVEAGTRAAYSPPFKMLAHLECDPFPDR